MVTPTIHKLPTTDNHKHTNYKPDGKNLEIAITITPSSAICDCTFPERVGPHAERKVTFVADDDCWINFTNFNVFRMWNAKLNKNVKEPLKVEDPPFKGETDFCISTGEPLPVPKSVSADATPVPRTPPKLVIP